MGLAEKAKWKYTSALSHTNFLKGAHHYYVEPYNLPDNELSLLSLEEKSMQVELFRKMWDSVFSHASYLKIKSKANPFLKLSRMEKLSQGKKNTSLTQS